MGKGKVVAKVKGGSKQDTASGTKSKGTSSTAGAGEGDSATTRAAKRAGKGKSGKSTSWAGYQDDLAEELHALGLRIKRITADGNCFFRALGDQLKGDEGMHSDLRAQIVSYVKDHEDEFAPFVEDDESLGTYTARMKKDGVWAGNIELVAASHTLGVNITIYQAGQPRWAIKNFDEGAVPMLHLSYHDGQHYNSVRMLSDPCTGPPLPIILGGDGVIKRAAQPEGGAGWGEKEVLRVSSSTACHDLALVRWALEQAKGDPDFAIEKVIERLASVPEDDGVLDTPQQQSDQATHPELSNSAQSAITQEGAAADGSGAAAVDAGPPALEAQSASSQQLPFRDQQQVRHTSQEQDTASSSECDKLEGYSIACIHAPEGPVVDAALSSGGDASSTAAGQHQAGPITSISTEGTSHAASSTTAVAAVATAAALDSQAAKPKKKVKTSVKLTGATAKAPARNKDCPCGSKRKYKNCCGTAAAAAARRLAAGGAQAAGDVANSQSTQQDGGVVVGKAAQLHAITI